MPARTLAKRACERLRAKRRRDAVGHERCPCGSRAQPDDGCARLPSTLTGIKARWSKRRAGSACCSPPDQDAAPITEGAATHRTAGDIISETQVSATPVHTRPSWSVGCGVYLRACRPTALLLHFTSASVIMPTGVVVQDACRMQWCGLRGLTRENVSITSVPVPGSSSRCHCRTACLVVPASSRRPDGRRSGHVRE